MPEYLTPGVYVEETSFRSRSIEGVPTSTFGMAGRTQYGPVPYLGNGATMVPDATLVTSFTEYDRAFGDLVIGGDPCYLALAARAFFANGGRRLYVARVFDFDLNPDGTVSDANFASASIPAAPGTPLVVWKARWPGSIGARINIQVRFRRSKNVLIAETPLGGGTPVPTLRGVRRGAAVEVLPLAADGRPQTISDDVRPDPATVQLVGISDDGTLGYLGTDGTITSPAPGTSAFHITLDVQVTLGTNRTDVYSELELGDQHTRSAFEVLQAEDPADEMSLVWIQQAPVPAGQQPPGAGQLLDAILAAGSDVGTYLTGGRDGDVASAAQLKGTPADPDTFTRPARGLEALGEIDDIAIVACPDTVALPDENQKEAVDNLIGHCERARYRIAIVDPPDESSITEVRRFRSQFDTTYAGLYYPWLRITDPTRQPDPSGPTPILDIPPSGAVAGIYARSDIARGVHKAPANEVILGLNRFVTNVTYDRQSVLNPEGINALRFFEGRANRVWGARTMSSDPEWRYINVRRLFIYLEHSIDKSTQWAVFEPNNERLWGSIRQSIEDFLLTVWRTGALMGTKPEEAFFVRCDRTTMTQNDLDNGRLICLIGVAPTYPAEFVIFRIGQWTADARRS
jgi:phage tail sheath protein FI